MALLHIRAAFQIKMDRLSKEAAPDGNATPILTFHDALENQVSLSSELSYALDSSLQTRDMIVNVKIDPPAQNPNQNDLNDTRLILPRT